LQDKDMAQQGHALTLHPIHKFNGIIEYFVGTPSQS